MVRSYLIENRIRFNSDSGSGGGGSDDNNPNADAARTQDTAAGYDNNNNNNDDNNISNIFGGAEMSVATPGADQEFEAFLNNQPEVRFSPPPPGNQNNNLSSGLSPDDIGLNAMLRNAAMQPPPTVLGSGTDDMGSGNPITDLTIAGRPNVYKDKVIRDAGDDAMAQAEGFANAQERNFYYGLAQNNRQGNDYREQVRGLDDRGFLGNQIASGIGQGGVPVLNQNNQIMGVNTTRDVMGFPMTTYTGRNEFSPNNMPMSVDDQLFYDQRNGADEPLVRALQARQEEAPIDEAPPVSDDLAVNYLQNPFYAYSGFGNQYNPYGYATGTLVDLLQTRNMTQPGQADTMGLFANPRDFT
jgi:hypothetical protein